MLVSLSNRRRTSGRLLIVLMAVSVTGCASPEIERPGTWKAVGINDQNLRAMLVNPQDFYSGTGSLTSRGDAGSRAAIRLLTDKRRTLLDASVSHIGSSSSSGADSGPPSPSAGGSAGGVP